MSDLPKAICGYPLPGWRLDHVQFDKREGQRDGWIVSLMREGLTDKHYYVAMARSDLGPLEAWDEALQIALRSDADTITRVKQVASMTDHPTEGLLARLRAETMPNAGFGPIYIADPLCPEPAARIERDAATITELRAEVARKDEALDAADKRLCELSPIPPPDGFECPEMIAEDAETCGVVMQIRAARNERDG